MSPRIELAVTCLCAPLQIEGTVAGVKVYYRARHHRWGIDLEGVPTSERAPEACGELEGKCELEQECSLAFAMEKIFSLKEIREAIVEADFAEYDAAEARVWAGIR